jgi:tryptophanase
MDLVRLAIPRRIYAQIHLNYIVGIFEESPTNKDNTRVIRNSKDLELLGNFTVHFGQKY